jgi:hypothetical protein
MNHSETTLTRMFFDSSHSIKPHPTQWLSQSLKMGVSLPDTFENGGSLSNICDRGAGGAKQTTKLLIE